MIIGRRLAILACGLCTLGLVACGGPKDRNLLVLCLDTVRTDAFFDPDIQDELTPWLNGALQYRRARATAPWTVPSIASAFTGTYPAGHGAGRFQAELANLDEQAPTALPPEAQTLAETLSIEGWNTAAFTAHPWMTAGFGLEQGFSAVEADRGRQATTSRLLDWVGRNEGQRWFAYLHWMEAHDRHLEEPRELRARLAELSADQRLWLKDRSNPELCQTGDERRCMKQQVYLDAVLDLRRGLAALLDDLQARGDLDNTVVIVFSDHGEGFREHGREHRELQVDPRGFYGMGHGQFHFAEVLDVPLLAWVPGVAGGMMMDNVSLVDIYPAALNWLGLGSTPPDIDGRALPEPGQTRPPERHLYASNIAYGPETLAMIRGDLKAMYWPDRDRFVMFDLALDPAEREPMDTTPELLELTTLAGDYLERAGQTAADQRMPDDEQLKALQSIGYLQGVEQSNEDDREPPPPPENPGEE